MLNEQLLNNYQINYLNTISSFLAIRDIPLLNKDELLKKYHLASADVLILLGSSLIYPLHLAADALNEGLVKKIMLVGGIGHSTHYLYDNLRKYPKYNSIKAANRAEADIYKDILIQYHGVKESDILIENQSTNCGSNAKNALQLFKESNITANTFIIMQDPTMQLRTYASFLHEWHSENVLFINYAPYIPALSYISEQVLFSDMPEDAWSVDRFISLLMGEIPRLYDNELGYGPNGKGYIVHIDIPADIMSSFHSLSDSLQDFLKNRI